MKSVFVLIKDDCDDFEGCITQVIGVFRLQVTARFHRKKYVDELVAILGDKVENKEKQDNIVRINTLSGSTAYIIDKQKIQ